MTYCQECYEQARLLGMGAEREATLLSQRNELRELLRLVREIGPVHTVLIPKIDAALTRIKP